MGRIEELNKLSINELRELCKKYCIKGYAKFKKSEYIEKIMEAEKLIADEEQKVITENTKEPVECIPYEKDIIERLENEKKIRTEIFIGNGWNFIRETLNGSFRKALFNINGKMVKLRIPSKKNISIELKERLNIDVKLK